MLDFDQDIYGQTIALDFIARLREEKKFNGVNELVAQIKNDIEQAKMILKEIRE
ncbi:MAG: riboflavin kinase [Chloroflexota bacterium]